MPEAGSRTPAMLYTDSQFALANWYANEALRLRRGARADPRLLRAATCLEWFQARGKSEIGLREIIQFGPAAIRTKALAEEAVPILMSHGWIVKVSNRPQRFQIVTDEGSV
jgi:hypothetical protein